MLFFPVRINKDKVKDAALIGELGEDIQRRSVDDVDIIKTFDVLKGNVTMFAVEFDTRYLDSRDRCCEPDGRVSVRKCQEWNLIST
jgi:hypothetical protein